MSHLPQQEASPVARWREAERRLYPLVLSAPELFERSLIAVRATADKLRVIDDDAQLAERFGAADEIVREAARDAGVELAGLDTAAVAGAAFSMRHGQIEAAGIRRAALDRLVAARRAGETWATIFEAGVVGADGGVMPPYHVVEAAVDRPVGLHSYAIFDMVEGGVRYCIEAVRVDHETGDWSAVDAAASRASWAERAYVDADSWNESRLELRRLLLTEPSL